MLGLARLSIALAKLVDGGVCRYKLSGIAFGWAHARLAYEYGSFAGG